MSERRAAAAQGYTLVPASSVDKERLVAFDAVERPERQRRDRAGEPVGYVAVRRATLGTNRLMDRGRSRRAALTCVMRDRRRFLRSRKR
jgi:hypothetical protein